MIDYIIYVRVFLMKRVSIIGLPGAGKTTMSFALSKILDVPVIEIDSFYVDKVLPNKPRDVYQDLCKDALDKNKNGWIVDGYHKSMQPERIWDETDTFIYIDLPKDLLKSRVSSRNKERMRTKELLFGQIYESKAGTQRLLSLIDTKHVRLDEEMKTLEQTLLNNRDKSFIRLSSEEDVNNWLAGVKP